MTASAAAAAAFAVAMSAAPAFSLTATVSAAATTAFAVTAAAALTFTVTMTTAAATAFAMAVTTTAAATLVAVLMTLTVSAHGGGRLRIRNERLGNACFDRFICISLNTSDETDSCRSKPCRCALADASTDDAFNAVFNKRLNFTAMTLTSCFNQTGCNDPPVLDVIRPELRGHAEMLINDVVFDRNGNLHGVVSFNQGLSKRRELPTAATGAFRRMPAIADFVATSFDAKGTRFNQRFGDLRAGPLVDFRDGCSRHEHLRSTLLMRTLFMIDDANRLVLLHKQHDRIRCMLPAGHRPESSYIGFSANAPAAAGSRHYAPSMKSIVSVICRKHPTR